MLILTLVLFLVVPILNIIPIVKIILILTLILLLLIILVLMCEYWRGHSVSPAGLPIEQVLGEYSIS